MYEYTQNYYDGGYRYPNPPWPIAGSPEQLDVDLDENTRTQEQTLWRRGTRGKKHLFNIKI